MPQIDPHSQHVASAILMVAPHDFEFNEQTSTDNEFQHRPEAPGETTNRQAMHEFSGMVGTLRHCGIEVVVPQPRSHGAKTPDAVFPNNWFSTESDGTVVLFPMARENRRNEKRMREVEEALMAHRFSIKNIINIGRINETEHFLEGTGSMIIDHARRTIYAALSERCHPTQLENFARLRDYRSTIVFHTASRSGKPFYHTNVMMSLGEHFAVICSACLTDADERQIVMNSLREHREVIDLTLEQVEAHFCANILQVQSRDRNSLIVMSQNAWRGFTQAQREQLSLHGTLVAVPLDTLEQVGGGSARCMMAEIFLPRAR